MPVPLTISSLPLSSISTHKPHSSSIAPRPNREWQTRSPALNDRLLTIWSDNLQTLQRNHLPVAGSTFADRRNYHHTPHSIRHAEAMRDWLAKHASKQASM